MIDEKLCHEALQRFARDAGKPGDGELFYVLLQKVLLGFATAPAGADISGALRENLGRRKLAAELMAVMAEVWRVLRDDGTCWVNLCDSYNAGTTAPST